MFVFFHGGGLEKGSKSGAYHFANYLTDRGIAVVSANYRMYPNAKYPDFIEDAAEAVYWVSENINSYGKCEKMFVGGSSAGGSILTRTKHMAVIIKSVKSIKTNLFAIYPIILRCPNN